MNHRRPLARRRGWYERTPRSSAPRRQVYQDSVRGRRAVYRFPERIVTWRHERALLAGEPLYRETTSSGLGQRHGSGSPLACDHRRPEEKLAGARRICRHLTKFIKVAAAGLWIAGLKPLFVRD